MKPKIKIPYPLRGNEKKIWEKVAEEYLRRISSEEGLSGVSGKVILKEVHLTKTRIAFTVGIVRRTEEKFVLERKELAGNREDPANIDRIIGEIKESVS